MTAHEHEHSISESYTALGVSFNRFYTENTGMKMCIEAARAASASDITVLILGENGTGKNMLAQAIHNSSPLADGPYVSVNCSALGENLIESELFGHERGSFTGADRTRKGKFELADKGTIFLDEIADMSPAAQAKVLRIVEYKEFERLGGEETHHVNVRVIAATNKDIRKLAREGIFREDLYFRLSEMVLVVPPLRDRPEDIKRFVEDSIGDFNRKFKKKVRNVSEDVMSFFFSYTWPGNLRELRNILRSAVAMSQSETITFSELQYTGLILESKPDDGPADMSLASAEEAHIKRVLQLTGGNKTRAAIILGISRSTLIRKVDDFT